MKKKLLVLLFSLASLALVSCGGGNDSASTGTPEVAMVVWTPYDNGGCGNSVSVNLFANGPPITNAQVDACVNAAFVAQTLAECNALGGSFSPQVITYGSCEVLDGPDTYNPVPPPPTY